MAFDYNYKLKYNPWKIIYKKTMSAQSNLKSPLSDRINITLLDYLSNIGHPMQIGKKYRCIFPEHGDSEPSFTIYEENGKQKFKCHSDKCGKHGDVIDLVRYIENCNFLDASIKLGLKLEENKKKPNRDKIIEYFRSRPDVREIKSIYEYQDIEGNPLYYAVKIINRDGKKEYPAVRFDINGDLKLNLHIPIICPETNQNLGTKSIEKVPYNLPSISKRLKDKKSIIITEGEKDVHTFKELGYVATTLKGVRLGGETKYNFEAWRDATVYFCGDTGEAGEKHRADVWNALKDYVAKFLVIELPGLEKLGDNKDVTDWIAAQPSIEVAKKTLINVINPEKTWNWKISNKWRDVIINKQGDVIPSPKSLKNLSLFLKSRGISFLKEEVTEDYTINAPEDALTQDKKHISSVWVLSEMWSEGCKVDRQFVNDALEHITSRKTYNYMQSILIKSRNTNHSIIDKFINLLNLETSLERTLVRKWLYNYVNQAFNELTREASYVSQGVLVIRGEQGMGKSRFVEALGLHDSAIYLRSSGLNPDDLDSVKLHTRRNLVELTEMLVSSKHEVEAMKTFLSQSSDTYRPLYSNQLKTRPRYTVFVATTNETSFLKDPTGSRRFWVVQPREIVQPDEGVGVLDVLGAVYDVLADKTPEERKIICGLNLDEIKELDEYNAQFYAGGNVGIIIRAMFNLSSEKRNFVTRDELFHILGNKGLTEKDHAIQVEKFLESQGVKVRDKKNGVPTHRIDGRTRRGYLIWDMAKDEIFADPIGKFIMNSRNIPEYFVDEKNIKTEIIGEYPDYYLLEDLTGVLISKDKLPILRLSADEISERRKLVKKN